MPRSMGCQTTRVWFTHDVVVDVAVGRTRDAGVAHLDASRRDVAVYVPEMDEHALTVVAAAAAAARRPGRELCVS